MNTNGSRPFTLEDVTDPKELEAARRRRAQFDANLDWLKAHAEEVYTQFRGKFISIAGQEVFSADTPEEALRLAKAAYPHDEGCFVRQLPVQRMPRVYEVAG